MPGDLATQGCGYFLNNRKSGLCVPDRNGLQVPVVLWEWGARIVPEWDISVLKVLRWDGSHQAAHVLELILLCYLCICAHGSAPVVEEHKGCCGYVIGAADGRVNGMPQGQVHEIIIIDGITNREAREGGGGKTVKGTK